MLATALLRRSSRRSSPGVDGRGGCGPRPTEAQIADSVQTYIGKIAWKDPDSVHVQNIRMLECRSIFNGLLNGGGHTVGWEIDFDVNAKNSYGGYTGFQVKSVVRTADGVIHWDPNL